MKLIGRAVALVFATFMAIWFWPVGNRIWDFQSVREARVNTDREAYATRDAGEITHLLWVVRRDRFSRDPRTPCGGFLLTFLTDGEAVQVELDEKNPYMREFMARKGRGRPPCDGGRAAAAGRPALAHGAGRSDAERAPVGHRTQG